MSNDKKITITADETLSVNGNGILSFDLEQIRSHISTSEADEFWNNVKSDGGDLRIYFNNTRKALDVRSFNSVSEEGFIVFDSSDHTASTSTQWDIEFGDDTLTQPAIDDEFGSQEVYTSLLSVYTMDEGSGTNITDSAGAGPVGTFNGNMTFSTGIFGSSLSFDGLGDFVSLDSNISFSSGDPWTISIWLFQTAGTDRVMSMGQLGSGNNRFYSRGDGTFWRVHFRDGNFNDLTSTTTDWRGAWHLHTFVCDGTTITFYLDGVQQDQVTPVDTGFITSGIGRAYPNDTFDWNGAIDETQFYNRTLPGTEVEEMYNNLTNQSGFWSVSNVLVFASHVSLSNKEPYKMVLSHNKKYTLGLSEKEMYNITIKNQEKYTISLKDIEVINGG